MCGCIITLIILALAIFIPTSYMMGVVHGAASYTNEKPQLPREGLCCKPKSV